MVHRESELDKFDEAFLSHFKGVVIETTVFPELGGSGSEDPEDSSRGLTTQQKAALQELSREELRRAARAASARANGAP